MSGDSGASEPHRRGRPSPLSVLKLAIQEQPAVGYALAVLGVVAAGSLALGFMAAFRNSYSLLWYSAATFGVVFVGMILFWIFRLLVDPKNPISRIAGQIAGILILLAVVSAIGAGGSAAIWQQPCSIAKLIYETDKIVCNPPQPTVEGHVLREDDPTAFVPKATVILRNSRTNRVEVNENGDYRFPLSSSDMEQDMEIWALADGFEKGQPTRLRPKMQLNNVDVVLRVKPSGPPTQKAPSIPSPKPPEQTQAIATQGVSRYKTGWFDGQNWTFDLFYCQLPDGNPTKSKIAAQQLGEILRAQNGVGILRVRPWPRSGSVTDTSLGTFEYEAPSHAVEINVTSSRRRDGMARNLTRLWTPAAQDIGTIGTTTIDSDFPDYISSVVCRQ